jgi:hypothetical protein
MKILCNDIAWDVAEGFDVTALPMITVIELPDDIETQDDFWVEAYEKLEEIYGIECFGFSYIVLGDYNA